jgi:hypothetical protein
VGPYHRNTWAISIGTDGPFEPACARSGSRTKTALSNAAGSGEVAVPRDREGTFEPAIVKKPAAAAGFGDRWPNAENY